MEDIMSFITTDLIIAVAILVAAIVFVYTIGKDFAVTMNLSVYLAFGTMTLVPLIRDFTLADVPDHYLKMAIFVILMVILGFLQTKNGFFEPIVVASGWESSVFAVTFAGMVIFVLASFVPLEMHETLSPYIRTLFIDNPVSSVWFLLPVATLLFIRGDA